VLNGRRVDISGYFLNLELAYASAFSFYAKYSAGQKNTIFKSV